MKTKKLILELAVAIFGVFAFLFALTLFNQFLLRTFSLPFRMVLMILTQWMLFIVPFILMLTNKEKLQTFGFNKENIPRQVFIGILIALFMSLALTLLPILLGYRDLVGSTTYTKAWQFTYEFIYRIFGVALVEELIFRGYIFYKLLEINNSKAFAIMISSLLFGLFHIFNGNLLQVLITSMIGLLYCIFRDKIKGCTLLSLIIAHGIYDALIVLLVAY